MGTTDNQRKTGGSNGAGTLKGSKPVDILYYLAAIFTPSILLIDLYNRNYVENLIIFEHIMILAGILAILGILLFVLLKWVTGSIEGALLVTGAFWVCFWLFHAVLSRVQRIFPSVADVELMVIMGICIVLASVCFRQFSPPFYKIRPAFNVLALCMVVLFFFNLFPAVSNQVVLSRARAGMSEDGQSEPFRIKRNFTVEPDLPNPDIHWIHVDGMMRMNTVESFWGEDFSWFGEQLSGKGFVLNEDAVLTAGYTYSALTAMLSPEFYDTFFGELIGEHVGELRDLKGPGMADGLAQVGLTYEDNLVPSYELLNAFIAAGYIVDIRNMDEYMPDYDEDRWALIDRFLNSDLPKLLSLTTPIAFPDRHERAKDENRQDNLFSHISDTSGKPKFIWYGIHEAHMDNVWLYDPDMHEVDATAIHLYPLAYYSAIQQALAIVDPIIEADPDAVIIIQSDHGFHMVPTQGTMLNMGYSKEFILDMCYSVFSAVRIPAQYGGVDAPMDPLNISRELVNRFVGENYTLR